VRNRFTNATYVAVDCLRIHKTGSSFIMARNTYGFVAHRRACDAGLVLAAVSLVQRRQPTGSSSASHQIVKQLAGGIEATDEPASLPQLQTPTTKQSVHLSDGILIADGLDHVCMINAIGGIQAINPVAAIFGS